MAKFLTRKQGSFFVEEQPVEQGFGELTDLDLMRLTAQGGPEAFDQLYLRHKSRLLVFIRRLVEDDSAAEDLLQETFLRVLKSADRYHPSSAFSTWLYRIATNLCLNELRRRRSHPHISLNQHVNIALSDGEGETVELHELIPNTSLPGPSEAVESSETIKEIMAAISGLSSVQQEVITLRICDNLNYEQIAEALNCSVGTAKSRTFYGLKMLRNRLKPKTDT